MTPLTFLLVAIAGGLGASARLLVDGAIRSRITAAYPFGTFVINVSGSLLLGIIFGLALSNLIPEELQMILAVGLLGGFTTFSTASFDTVGLIQDRRYVAAVGNGIGMLLSGVAASALGLWLAFALDFVL